MRSQKNIDKLVTDALEIEAEAAREAGMLGFMCRSLVQATMPHKNTNEQYHVRQNGDFELIMSSGNPKVGLPYGTMPRLLVAWLTTEAVRTQERKLILGNSMSEFMCGLGLIPSGGRWGTIFRLKDQSKRLFSCMISCTYTNNEQDSATQFLLADKRTFWWHPDDPNQAGLFDSSIILSEPFFNEVVNNPIPLDIRALRALKHSSMALDIYCWLTYRNSYLRDKTAIPWKALQMQFGSSYPLTPQGTRNFKKKFLMQLKAVRLVYPEAKLEETSNALILKPSPPHIPFGK